MENSVTSTGEPKTKGEEGESVILERLVGWRETAEEATQTSRELAERCRDYYDGNQWTDAEIAALKKRKQPIVTDNRIKKKVDFLRGLETQKRTDPKAFPRNPGDEEGANAATDGLRFVGDDQKGDRKFSDAYDNYLVEGACGFDISVVEKTYDGKTEYCVEWNQIVWHRMWWDAHSTKRDFSDAKYKGQDVWMDLEDAKLRWPGKEAALNSTLYGGQTSLGNTYDDVPRLRWSDPKRERVRISECWSSEGGKVYFTQFTKAGILDRIESPYVDDDGEPEDGWVFGSCFIDRDGNRYGIAANWLSTQDEINKRRSKALHLLSVRQTAGEKGAVADVSAMKRELAKPDGHVEYVPGLKFEVLPTGDMAAAQFQLLIESQNALDSVGVNASLTGTDDSAMSGRAQMVRQESGLAELGPVLDGFTQLKLDVYRKTWNRIRQFWTSEKWVRVTDDENKVRFVGLNTPMTAGEKVLSEAKTRGIEIAPEQLEMLQSDPNMQQVVGRKNDVSTLDVDIVIEEVPATAALQVEQFSEMAALAKAGMAIPPKAIIKASSLRNKDAILEEMETQGVPPQIAKQMQEMQTGLQEAQKVIAEQQMQLQDKSAEHQQKDRELDQKDRELDIKTRDSNIKGVTSLAKTAQAGQQFGEGSAGEPIEGEVMEAEQVDPIAHIDARFAQLAEMLETMVEAIVEQINEPKKLTLQAPSGRTYTAVSDGQNVQIETPSGNYAGTIQ